MALYLIEKSNVTGRWTGRQWWVEANSEREAIAIGRQRWPSKNSVDQFHARPLTEEEINDFYSREAEHDLRIAGQPLRSSWSQQRLDRKMAYLDQCRQNLIRSNSRLDYRGTVPATQGKVIDDLAKKIERDHR